MNRAKIDRFLRILSREYPEPLRVILTGAAAGVLFGHVRASVDIDFAVRAAKRDPATWDRVREAVARVTRITKVSASYAEDIDRWSQITYLDYDKHVRPYKKFKDLSAEVLEPAYWSIGKMARAVASDVRDMAKVFKKQKVPAESLAHLWGKALKKSPRSTALLLFRKNVERFLAVHGRGIWGKTFDLEKTMMSFRRATGMKPLGSAQEKS